MFGAEQAPKFGGQDRNARCEPVLARRCGTIVRAGSRRADAGAQGDVTERQVKVATGHDERVGIYTNIKPDCTGGPLPAIRLLAAPAHGSVTVKRGTLKATNFKQCLAAEVPALLAFYRSAANFNGSDEFELEITLQGGRKQVQHFRVDVSASPAGGGGKGI